MSGRVLRSIELADGIPARVWAGPRGIHLEVWGLMLDQAAARQLADLAAYAARINAHKARST